VEFFVSRPVHTSMCSPDISESDAPARLASRILVEDARSNRCDFLVARGANLQNRARRMRAGETRMADPGLQRFRIASRRPRPQRLVLAIHAFSGCIHSGKGWKNAPCFLPVEMATSLKDLRWLLAASLPHDPSSSDVS
jgi:hypothetical protein